LVLEDGTKLLEFRLSRPETATSQLQNVHAPTATVARE